MIWEKTLIAPGASVQDAVSVLNDNYGYHIAVVVDEKRKLLGTITDGDVRRAILRNISLNTSVVNIMNKSPKVMRESENKTRIKALLLKEKLRQIIIVDDLDRVVNVEVLSDISTVKIKNNKIVIMAGGYGKRLKPLTNSCPKPMLSIGDKPLLEHIINDFMQYGFVNFVITVHYLQDQIKTYFGNGEKFGINIEYIHERTPLGTGGYLNMLLQNNLPFIQINGDVLTKVHYEHLLNFHSLQNADISLCIREHKFEIPFGVVNYKDNKLLSIREKPVLSEFVNAGLYVINPAFVNKLNLKPPFDMVTVLEYALQMGFKVAVFPIHEYWIDVGRHHDYESAKNEYLVSQ